MSKRREGVFKQGALVNHQQSREYDSKPDQSRARFHVSDYVSTTVHFARHLHESNPLATRVEGLEPPTLGFEGRCSIQLSYTRLVGRGIIAPHTPE